MLGGVWAPLWSLSVLGYTLLCSLNKAAKAVQTVQLPAAVCNSGEGRQRGSQLFNRVQGKLQGQSQPRKQF